MHTKKFAAVCLSILLIFGSVAIPGFSVFAAGGTEVYSEGFEGYTDNTDLHYYGKYTAEGEPEAYGVAGKLSTNMLAGYLAQDEDGAIYRTTFGATVYGRDGTAYTQTATKGAVGSSDVIQVSSALAHSGTKSLMIKPNARVMSLPLRVQGGTSYQLTFYGTNNGVQGDGGSKYFGATVMTTLNIGQLGTLQNNGATGSAGSGGDISNITGQGAGYQGDNVFCLAHTGKILYNATSEFEKFTLNFTTSEQETYTTVYLSFFASAGMVYYIDDVSLVDVTPAPQVATEVYDLNGNLLQNTHEYLPVTAANATGGVTLSVNTAALTGESLPRDISAGDRVVSGSVNLNGVITVKTESVYRDSTVAKILDLVENSSSKKAKTENFITRFARYYTPCVVAAAVLLAVLPPLISGGGWTNWLQRALIFLVVSCPCALVISVPLSFFGGIGGASKRGILIKGANYTEVLAKVGTVVFDKTGTLTKGVFKVTAVHPESMSEAELLDVAAAAESYSNHPIAESIIAAHKGHIDRARIGRVTEHAGMGVEAVIDGRDIFAGNGKLMELAGANPHDCHIAGTVIHISEGKNYLGHIVISDELKPDSKTAVAELKALGITKTVMLTGDLKEIGEAVGKELGLDEVCAELLPDGKVNAVEKLLNQKTPLAFVGDGINDAPVLARADIGIAMGGMGSDAAIEAADVVLMYDKPSKLPEAVKIARKTMSIVLENIIFALAVKAVVLVLGAAGIAGMWLAIFADVGVTVIAVLNAIRAMRT